MNSKIDPKQIHQIFNANTTAKSLAKYLASRERASRVTNLNQCRYIFKNGFKKKGEKKFAFQPFPNFNRQDFDNTWLALQELGIGSVGYTPRGVPVQFEWNGYEASSIGATALDPKKPLVLAEFRERQILEKKSHARIVKTSKRPVQAVIPRMNMARAEKNFEASEPIIAGNRIFANFMTQNFENVRLEFKQGLSEKDKERLIEMIQDLPVNQ